MIDTLIALVPTYGVWIVMGSVILSCLAMPLPSSILVMVGGGFAAAGDMSYLALVAAAFTGFMIGDQLAYGLARRTGAPILDRLGQRPEARHTLDRAQGFLARRGMVAVFLSRTILSPIGPYVGYISGALRYRWLSFTLPALAGGLCWSLTYSALGYTFAEDIAELASLIGSTLGFLVAAVAATALLAMLVRIWRQEVDRYT